MPTPTILGLDIGGANLKAATCDKRAVSVPFALWKQPDRLPATLAELAAKFPDAEELAVTMTGELCDCFESRREGVAAIIKAVRFASGGRRIRVWSTDGVFVNDNDAKANHLKVASANWHALATFAGRYVPTGPSTLIDMGSTTTDVIPLLDGLPVPIGKTDYERLSNHELVYTGVARTPLIALAETQVAAEVFATTRDVYLYLGMIAEDPEDTTTADGRPSTRVRARARMARLFCGDIDEVDESQILNLAEDVRQRQVKLIDRAYDRRWTVIELELLRRGRRPDAEPPRVLMISGSGEFLLRYAIRERLLQLTAEPLSMEDQLGPAVSACAPAYAVAVLATEAR